MRTATAVVDFDALERRLPSMRESYRTARPFPHVVLDDVLPPDVFARACSEFDAVSADAWTNYLHVNERKFADTEPETWGPTLRAIGEALQSERFTAALEQLTGFDGLIADRSLDGGGLHRSVAGGFLNVHADFTAHHVHDHWRRRVNLLLYMNCDWDPAWGGSLELWETDMSACTQRIAPIGNRAVIFTTDDDSFHGHPNPLECPEGVARQSLALYYFTAEPEVHVRSTNYQPTPDDTRRKTAAIYFDKFALAVYDRLKRRLHLSDGVASRALAAASRRRRRH